MADSYGKWGALLARIKEIEDKLDASIRSYFDNFEYAIASAVASEHWTGEVYVGGAEDSDADINTTTAGKAYVIADPDVGPAATGYWLRKNITRNAPYYTAIVDADYTWGTEGAGNLFGGLWITKGAAYDADNALYIVRMKTTTGPQDYIVADGVLNGVGLTGVTAAIDSDAVAFKIERWDDQYRFYYSLTQSPDYNWVYVTYFEDTSNYMTDETSICLMAYSPGAADIESVQVDYDNFKYYVNTASIDQMLSEGYNSTHILANKNGSILEMQKYMTGKLATIDGGGSGGGDGAQTGDVYYVHSSGADSNTGSYAEPFLTTDYGISQLAENQDDILVIMASATPYDEDANTNGVIVDKAGITIIGEGNEKDDSVQFVNSNGAATSVFDVTAANCHIKNIAITEVTATVEGIVGSGNELSISGCRFDGLMENAIHLTGHDNLIQHNYIHDPTNDGIELEGDRNLVRYNEIVDAGDNGISAIAGSDDNIMYSNIINGVADTTNGINIAGADNFCPLNEIANCATASVVDSGARNFFGETSTGGTVRQFNASLYDVLGGPNGIPVFPAAADMANGVSMAEGLRGVQNSLVGDDNFDDWTDVNNTTAPIASLDAVLQRYFSVVGCDNTNVFNPLIQGANFTTFETAINALATYFSPAAAAWSVQMFNQTADADLETTWEQWLTTWGIDGTNVFTDINAATPASVDGIFQAFATLWAADGANVFNPTIFGAARTDLETALNIMATYFSPAAAAWSVQMNNATADASLEETWEEYTTVVGVNGVNQLTNINNTANLTFDAVWQQFAALWAADGGNVFNPTIFGAARTDLELALTNLATYFSVGAAAWSVQMNNATADASLEDTWEEWVTVVGVSGVNQLTNINNTANLTFDAVWQQFAALWGADGANVFNPTIDGSARTTLEAALEALAGMITGGSVKNTMINRDMPYLTEFWETEALDNNVWEEVLDGAGTGAFTVEDGYMYYNIDTENVNTSDARINSKYRWQCRPATFSDTNTSIEKLEIEWEARTTGALADIVEANFIMGLVETKDNDNTDNNIAVFTLDGAGNLISRTDDDATDEDSGTLAGTLTDWNKFKIEVYATGYKFYINEALVSTHETQVPDEAMYIMLATRSDGVGAVGLDIGNVRMFYYEVV